MPHAKSTGSAKLGRKIGYRNMVMRNLATSLILHEKVTTTRAKAKLVKPYLDRLISKAVLSKADKREVHRALSRELLTEKSVMKLLDEIKPRMEGRVGGYVSVVGAGFRHGDGAEISIISLVPGKEVKKVESSSQAEAKAPAKSITGKEKVTVKRKTKKVAA